MRNILLLGVILSSTALLLTGIGWHLLGRLLGSLGFLVLFHVPLLLGLPFEPKDYYVFGYRYFIFFTVPLFFYDLKTEWFATGFSLAITTFFWVTYDSFFIRIFETYHPGSVPMIKSMLINQKVQQFIMLCLVLSIFLFLKRNSQRFENELRVANNLLNEKNDEIATQNEEIISQNEELLVQHELLTSHQTILLEKTTQLEKAQETIAFQNQELQGANDILEKKVLERTRHISIINEELLLQNQQLEQFAFMVAHNLRAPVARILGLIDVFELEELINSENTYLISKLQDSAFQLDEVIKDLTKILEIKNNSRDIYTSIELYESVNKVLLSLEKEIKESEATIEFNVQSPVYIMGIKSYVENILYNLMHNALKYKTTLKQALLRIQFEEKESDILCLKVIDNGIGLDVNAHKENLFKPYKRFHTHLEGKGLGLYLVKTQVDGIGGHISIESKVGIGTTVTVCFKKAIFSKKKSLLRE